MNTKELAVYVGLKPCQINYFVEVADVFKRNKTQGKARVYTDRDVKLFKIAGFMKLFKVKNQTIYEMLDYIDKSGFLEGGWK